MSNPTGGDAQILDDDFTHRNYNLERHRLLILPQNFVISSKQHQSSLSNYCCLLLVWINVLKVPLGQLRNNDDLLFRLKLKFTFLNSCKSTLFQNFKKMVAHEFLIRGVQQLENMFSIACKDLYSWLNIVCLSVNDLSRYDVSRIMTVSNLANSC
jgi:hypothetical protein